MRHQYVPWLRSLHATARGLRRIYCTTLVDRLSCWKCYADDRQLLIGRKMIAGEFLTKRPEPYYNFNTYIMPNNKSKTLKSVSFRS